MVWKPIHSAHRPKVRVTLPPRPITTPLSSDKRNQRASDLPYNKCKRCRTAMAIWKAMPCGHLIYCDICKIQFVSLRFRRPLICPICSVRIEDFVRSGGSRPAARQPAAAAAGAPAGPAAAAAAAAALLPTDAAPTTADTAALRPTTDTAAASGSGVPQPAARQPAAAAAAAAVLRPTDAAPTTDAAAPTTDAAAPTTDAAPTTTVSVHYTGAPPTDSPSN